jgi:hypothetical protein
MAAIPGTVIGAPIVLTDSADTYPTHKDIYGLGGLRTVADTTARDAIPAARRQEGMVVYCQTPGKFYKLNAGLTTWSEQASISGLAEHMLMVGFTGGTYTQYTGLQFNPKGGYGDDPELTIGTTGMGTNYCALNIMNYNGTVNRIQTGSSDTMRILGHHNVEILAGEDGGISGNIRLETASGSIHIDAAGEARLKGTTVSVCINDSGCQFAVISGSPVGSGSGACLGFYTTSPIAKPVVSGSRASNAALASLLTQLANLGLITDSTS